MYRQLVRDFGTCLNFKSATDQVSIPAHASTSFIDSFSIMAWIKPISFGGGGVGRIAQRDNGSSNNRFIFAVNSAGKELRALIGATDVTSNDGVIRLHEWQHVALTWDRTLGSNQIKFYVNGVHVGSGTRSTAITVDSTPLLIGNNVANTRGFLGKIDEVEVYNIGLTTDQVLDNYLNGPAEFTERVALIKFNEGSGTSAIDSEGVQGDGTITGATYSSDVVMVPRTAATNRMLIRDFGTCLKLDGVDDTVSCGNLGTLGSSFENNGKFSVAFWLKTMNKTKTVLCGTSNTGSVTTINLSINKNSSDSTSVNRLGFFVRDDDNHFRNLAMTNTYPVTDGNWHFIVANCTPMTNAWEIYIDNISQALTLGGPSGTIDNFSDFANGYRVGSGVSSSTGLATGFTKGKIDKFMLFQRFLTTTEIADMYYRGIVPTDALVKYEFDEGSGTTANDSGSLATNGTITGAAYSSDVPMVVRTAASNRFLVRDFGTCLNFVSGSNKVTIPGTSLATSVSSFTFCHWVWVNGLSSADQIFNFRTTGATGVISFKIQQNNNNIRINATNSLGATSSFNLTRKITFGKWTHLALTWDGTTIKGYVDAVLDATTGILASPMTFSTSDDMVIGNNVITSADLTGKLDDFIYFNRAITAQEVSDIYYKGIIPTDGLLINYKYDEGSGTSAIDSSGNGVTGTISGATYSSDVVLVPRTAVS